MLTIKIGDYLLDTDDSTKVGFKYTSGWVDGIQADGKYRTFDFSVPATAKNNGILLHSNNTSFDGMRQSAEAVIGDSGVWLDGVLYLRSCNKERYNLLFIHGVKASGLNVNKPVGVFKDEIPVYDKMPLTLGGTIPVFGFYSYNNGLGNTQALAFPLDHMPVVNFGYWLTLMAGAAGYSITYPANSGWLSPRAYGIVLPTANTYAKEEILIQGSAHGGWTYTVSSGHTLADAGLQIVTKRYKRGLFNENVTVYVFQALKHVKIKMVNAGMIPFKQVRAMGGEGYDCLNGVPLNEEGGTGIFELETGEWVTFVNRWSDLNIIWRKWYGGAHNPAGYTSTVTLTISVETDDGIVASGQNLNLEDNMPDLTLEEGLKAFCDIIAGTYTVNTDLMTIDVTTLSAKLGSMAVGLDLNSERVIKIGDVKPYIEGLSQHNIVVCESADYVSEDKRFRRDYPCENDYLEEESEMSKIPFNEGNWNTQDVSGTNYKTVFLDDITAGDDGTNDYKGVLTIICESPANVPALHLSVTTDDGVGLDYANFTRDALTLDVSVRLPLYKYLQIYTGTLVHFGSRDWVIRSAQWSDGVCGLTLLSYT